MVLAIGLVIGFAVGFVFGIGVAERRSMMPIKIESLTDADVGRWVLYAPRFSYRENGRVKSWNEKFIFVVYGNAAMARNWQDYTAAATLPLDLDWVWASVEGG